MNHYKTLIAAAALFGGAGVSQADNNLLFILDASNSMWGQVDGTAKIDTAKSVFGSLLGQLSSETHIGLMAYGHRDRDDCSDIEVLAPIGTSPDQIRQTVQSLSPRGKTPIAASLQQSWDAFVGSEEQTNSIVLISDGIETCNDDPCAVAEDLARRNVNLRVHVVGFDVDAEARTQLECIADKGGGQYFPADSTEGFSTAVAEVIRVAQAEPEAAPTEPKRERVFFDDFDGDALEPHWSVSGDDPDAYAVEDGTLLAFSAQTSGFYKEDMANVFTLIEELPDGDWDAIVRFSGEFRTGRDQFWLGLRNDHENFLSVDLYWEAPYVSGLRLLKYSRGASTETRTSIYENHVSDEAWEKHLAIFKDNPGTLTLSKRGRSYFASYANEGLKELGAPTVSQSDKLTSLRVPGQLAFGISKSGDASGEVLTFIDSVEIMTVTE